MTLQAARRSIGSGVHFPNPLEFQMHGRRGYYHARLTNWYPAGLNQANDPNIDMPLSKEIRCSSTMAPHNTAADGIRLELLKRNIWKLDASPKYSTVPAPN